MVCDNCPLHPTFAKYLGSHLFPLLTIVVLNNVTLGGALLALFLKDHSSHLLKFTAIGVHIDNGS